MPHRNPLKSSFLSRPSLKWGLAGLALFALFFLSGSENARAKTGAATPEKLTGLLHNEDCTYFFMNRDFPPGKGGEMVDRYIDRLADAGVSVLMCNTNSQKTNYRSKVWEAFWDGYDPNGPDDQPFLAALPPEGRKDYRKLLGNMLELDSEGVDYPARVIQRCRQDRISPWISLRMNDIHYGTNFGHPCHSAFWRQTEFLRKEHDFCAYALDYGHEEVRAYYRALIAETLERYDIDGLELDFMREPYLFKNGKEPEGGALLTEWLRDIRSLADEAAKRRGHPVKMGVRVPSSPDTALSLGLDAPAWAKEGLVDLVVATPRWATLEYAMPLEQWRELLGNRVTLAGGLEVLYRPDPAAPLCTVTREQATGAAMAVLSRGADVVYLFNYFQLDKAPYYESMLKSFSSLEELRQLPRVHAVTYRDITSSDENYQAPLPASGTRLAFDLPLGPTPPPGWKAEATIEIAASDAQNPAPAVTINGTEGKLLSSETAKSGSRIANYAFPLTALPGKNSDTLLITAADPVTVQRVEVALRPGQTP